MLKETGALIPMNNADMLNGLRGSMSTVYRDRVPVADQGNLSEVIREIQSYKPHMNEVIEALVNRIGMELFRRNTWSNPLGIFKLGLMEFGDTVEEVQVGLLEAHRYNTDRDSTLEELYGTELPEIQSSFHKVTRQDYYKVTISEKMLKRAFLNSSGLQDMVSQLIQSATNSDNYDEFLLMTQLFSEYDANGGFYRVNIPAVSARNSTEADAKQALRAISETASNLDFMDPKYNAANMEIAVDKEDFVLFVSPGFKAAVDINALMAAFNQDYGKVIERVIVIPKDRFGAKDVEAVLTTKNFFVVLDTLFESATLHNPAKLTYNFFLHHHSIISTSRFVPAIAFTTGPGTEDEIVDDPTTGISKIYIDAELPANEVKNPATADLPPLTDVQRGTKRQFLAWGTTAGGLKTAVRWNVKGEGDFTTHVTPEGVLHVSGVEESTQLEVRATTVEVDTTDPRKAGFTVMGRIGVKGDPLNDWPVPAE